MGRIGKAYEARFRSLLLRLRSRHLEKGVAILVQRALATSAAHGEPASAALSAAYEHLRGQVRAHERRSGQDGIQLPDPRFLCDVGLGGLARWLRAAGYDAAWFPDLDDAELLRCARELKAILLTTDSLLMERGELRDGLLPAFWLPPVGGSEHQLGLVLREFGLRLRTPRCMPCGGRLQVVEKASVWDRIPPKTRPWRDEYFICVQCGRLFWRGTHWMRIRSVLEREIPGQTAG